MEFRQALAEWRTGKKTEVQSKPQVQREMPAARTQSSGKICICQVKGRRTAHRYFSKSLAEWRRGKKIEVQSKPQVQREMPARTQSSGMIYIYQVRDKLS